MKVQIIDTFAFTPIKIPVRGKLCTHLQVFDLETYLKLNCEGQRTLKCPICSKNTVDLIIDDFFYSFMLYVKANKEQFKDDTLMSGSASESDDEDLLPGEKESEADDLPWDSVYLLKDDKISVGNWIFSFNLNGKHK